MEEEPERIDLGDLDILGSETACHQKAYDKIPTQKIEILEVALLRA